MLIKIETDEIIITADYDATKKITSIYHDKIGTIMLDKPIIGAYLVEARPKKDGAFIDGIGLWSCSYEITKDEAIKTAQEYLTLALNGKYYNV